DILGVDSPGEPFFAEPMNPLESLKAPKDWAPESINELAPVFSDKIKPTASLTHRGDYRGSPVLASSPGRAFLNLDLSDHPRWRLHPDQPRSRATLDAVVKLGLQERRDAAPIDW